MRWMKRLQESFSVLEGNLLVLTLSWMLWFPAMRMTGTYGQQYTAALGATLFILGVITFGVASACLFYAFAQSWEWILVGTDSVPPEKRGTGFAPSLVNSYGHSEKLFVHFSNTKPRSFRWYPFRGFKSRSSSQNQPVFDQEVGVEVCVLDILDSCG